MPGKGHNPEQVLNKFRQAEVAVAGGKSVGQAVRGTSVTDYMFYRWRDPEPRSRFQLSPVANNE